jgi:hypothetical protein
VTYAVVIGTYNRAPGPNYLAGLVQSLTRSGLWTCGLLHDQRLTIAEGGSASPEQCQALYALDRSPDVEADDGQDVGEIDLILAPERLTSNAAFLQVVECGIATEAPWVVTLEDDVVVATNFLWRLDDWLGRHETSWMQMAPLYCPYQDTRAAHELGVDVWTYPVQAFYGSQGLLWRREGLQAFAEWYRAGGLDGHGEGGLHDIQIQAWHARTWPDVRYFATPVPSLLQHVGRYSALGLHERFHTAPCVAPLA